MAVVKVPHLLKHCTLAIYNSGDISGGKREKFVSAWNIARSRLVEYGYLAKGSEKADAGKIKLTSKGTQRENVHAHEPGGKAKSEMFDAMFKWIELAQEAKAQEKDPDQDTSPEGKTEAEKTKLDTKIATPLLNTAKKASPKHGLKQPPARSKLGSRFNPKKKQPGVRKK